MLKSEAIKTQRDLLKAGITTKVIPVRWVKERSEYEFIVEECSLAECQRDVLAHSMQSLKDFLHRIKIKDLQANANPKGFRLIRGGKDA